MDSGFLTVAEMARVIERIVVRILCLTNSAKFDYSLHFYFYERKQNKCVHVLYCDITTIKEDCCWLFFFKTQYSI